MIFPVEEGVTCLEYSCEALQKVRGVSVAAYNIRGLINKLDEIAILLKRSKLDVLILCETFLTSKVTDCELEVNGYNFFRSDRTLTSGKTRGGGLLIYSNLDRDVTCIPEGKFCDRHIETLWVKLILKRARPTYILGCYRPPDGNLDSGLKIIQSQ